MRLDYETPRRDREPPQWSILWIALGFALATLIARYVVVLWFW